MNGARLVLLFNNCARADLAARIHTADCHMVNMAGRRGQGRRVNTINDPDQETIDDLNERGFTVKHCKCTKGVR